MKQLTFVIFAAAMLVFASCTKYKDTPGDPNNPLLNRPYCNDPEGVNYNWDFPGKPDNTTCLYPTDVFRGEYVYTDSIYDGSQKFLRSEVRDISMTASSKTKLIIAGLCASSSLTFTASRRLRADADTISFAYGQPFCRAQDTLSGAINRPNLSGPVSFNLIVGTDTGTFYHRGAAVRK